MAKDKHQFILGLIVRKMREEGIKIYNVDGIYGGLFGEKLPLPPKILRHRPDIIGIRANGQICIGEAKTESDILNTRTFEQLQDYTSIDLNGIKCDVFIGIPKSARYIFDKQLKKLGLSPCNNLHILYIPDELINS